MRNVAWTLLDLSRSLGSHGWSGIVSQTGQWLAEQLLAEEREATRGIARPSLKLS